MKTFRQHISERKLDALEIIVRLETEFYEDHQDFFKSLIAGYDGTVIGKGSEATVYAARDPSSREFVVRLGEEGEEGDENDWRHYADWCQSNYGKNSLIPKILWHGWLPDGTHVGVIEHLKVGVNAPSIGMESFFYKLTLVGSVLITKQTPGGTVLPEEELRKTEVKYKQACEEFSVDPDEFLWLLNEVYGKDLYSWNMLDIHGDNVGRAANGVLKVFDA